MKKFLKIVGIVVLALLLVIIILPYIFKPKIKEIAKEQLNSNLNAQVYFDDVQLSLLKGFPNLYVAITGMHVVGIDDFKNDTLIKFDKFATKVDIISALKKNIKIKEILIEKPIIHALINKEGKTNWDIAKSVEEEEIDTTETDPVDFKASLKKFLIKDAYIYYQDDSSEIHASLENMDFLLSGDLSQDFTSLLLETTTQQVSVKMEGIKYLNNALLDVYINLDADLENMIFTLNKNKFTLNDLILNLDGQVSMPDTQNVNVDLHFKTGETNFKSLLSLVPAIYAKDFEDIQSKGELVLQGSINGTYNEYQEIMPSASLQLKVKDAMFKYPDLPKSANNINIDVDVNYDGVDEDKTKVDINQFHIEFGNNPIDLVMKIRTPMSDPGVEGKIDAKIDLGSFADVIPLDETTVKGLIVANIELGGKMSMIENEQYEQFKADGQLICQNIEYNSPDIPQPVKINRMEMYFSPKQLDLKQFDMYMGQSDFHLTGTMTNFIPYTFSDGIVSGNLKFNSSMINVDELMPAEEETIEQPDTASMAVFEVPGNINFSLYSTIDKMVYDNLVIEKIKGGIAIKEEVAKLNNLDMKLLGGTMLMNGSYHAKEKLPKVHYELDMDNIDIPMTFVAFNTVKQLAPIAGNAEGKIDLYIDFDAILDQQLSPILNTMNGKGYFSSNNIVIKNSTTFQELGQVLNTKTFDKLNLDDIEASFEIKEGRITLTDPVTAEFGNSKLELIGSQGIDQTMDYDLGLQMPRSSLGSSANQAISTLSSQAKELGLNVDQNENLFIHGELTGSFSNPQIKLNLKESAKDVVEDVKEQVKEQVKKEVEKKVDMAKEKASAEAEKIIQQAEQEAKRVRVTAKETADKIRKEADNAYNEAVKKANQQPKFTRDIAIKAAKKIRDEAYSKADNIEKEAAQKSNAIINEAKQKAAKIN